MEAMNNRENRMINLRDVYLGSYSCDVTFGDGSVFHGKGKGVSCFSLNEETGELTENAGIPTENPSYLTLNKNGTMLYAVNELEDCDGEAFGAVSSFRKTENGFVFCNRKLTKGLDPCHVILTPDERYLCVSNYGSGSLIIFEIPEDGSIGEAKQFMQHEGHGADPNRQEGPHCHSVSFSTDGRYAYVLELGTDEILCYELSAGNAPFIETEQKRYKCMPGDGPRFLCFDHTGKYAYTVNELSNTISLFSFDPANGELRLVDRYQTLPEDAKDIANTFADIHISPDNRFLYGSNRGHDSIVRFRLNPENGRLGEPEWISCGGRTPRCFAIDPSGKFLICANQDSNNAVVFRIDPESGLLSPEKEVYAGSPVCVRFFG